MRALSEEGSTVRSMLTTRSRRQKAKVLKMIARPPSQTLLLCPSQLVLMVLMVLVPLSSLLLPLPPKMVMPIQAISLSLTSLIQRKKQ